MIISIKGLKNHIVEMKIFYFLHLCNALTLYFFCLIPSVSLRSWSTCASLRRASSSSWARCSTRCSCSSTIRHRECCFCLSGSYSKMVSSFSRFSGVISPNALINHSRMKLHSTIVSLISNSR